MHAIHNWYGTRQMERNFPKLVEEKPPLQTVWIPIEIWNAFREVLSTFTKTNICCNFWESVLFKSTVITSLFNSFHWILFRPLHAYFRKLSYFTPSNRCEPPRTAGGWKYSIKQKVHSTFNFRSSMSIPPNASEIF